MAVAGVREDALEVAMVLTAGRVRMVVERGGQCSRVMVDQPC